MRTNVSTAWDYLDDCVFVAHRPGPLIDSDFAHFLDDMLPRTNLRKVVVRASDGAPRADHRASLLRWYRQYAVRGAVLTSSIIARGGVTALSWFGVPIRALDPQELEAAFEYVGIPQTSWPKAREHMERIVSWVDQQCIAG